MKIPSLATIVYKMASAIDADIQNSPGDHEKITTSIRLENDLREFVLKGSQGLGVSIQQFIEICIRGVMDATRNPEISSKLDLMVQRFFEVFEAHQIPTADIPKILNPYKKSSVKLSDLLHKESLLNVIDDDLMTVFKDIFCVSPRWMKGEDQSVFDDNENRFYKHPGKIVYEIGYHLSKGRGVRLLLCSDKNTLNEAFTRENVKLTRRENDTEKMIFPVLQITYTDTNPIFTSYQVWQDIDWDYCNTRYALKALVLFCDKVSISTLSASLSSESFELFKNRTVFPSTLAFNRFHIYSENIIKSDGKNLNSEDRNVQDFYEKSFQIYEPAIKNYRLIKDWDEVRRKGLDLEKYTFNI